MWIDITEALENDMQTYPGDMRFTLTRVKNAASDGYTLSELQMGAHNGTHVDSPAHFVVGGITIEAMPAELMTGIAYAVAHAADVKSGMQRVLLTKQATVDKFEADALIKAGVKLLVVKSMSVGDADAHRALLGGGCWVCENARTDKLIEGEYELICAPLKISGCEGAPARVLAERKQ